MLYKIQINRQIALPINKANYELLVPVCKKLIADFEDVNQIYLHHNTLYVLMGEMVHTDSYLLTFGVGLGNALYKHFRQYVPVIVYPCVQTGFTEAARIEKANAEMLYEAYVESLTTDCTTDLFGSAAIIPFEKLPEFFRLGTYFKGKSHNKVTPKKQVVDKAWEQINSIIDQGGYKTFEKLLFEKPEKPPMALPPTLGDFCVDQGPVFS